MKTRIAIIGWEEGLAGQITGWVEKYLNWQVVCYVNPSDQPIAIDLKNVKPRPASQFDYPSSERYKGRPLINARRFAGPLAEHEIGAVALAISDSRSRAEVFGYLETDTKLEILNCIHPSAVVLDEVLLGRGVIIEPHCYVGYRAELGNGVYLKAGSQVDHQSVVQDFCTLNPRAVVAGNTMVGKFSTLHTNATVINRVTIAANSVVGAGGVVIRDIPPPGGVYVGVPAKRLKTRTDP